MSKLPDFLYCTNQSDSPGNEWILSTKPPFRMGRVVKFKNSGLAMEYMARTEPLGHYRVPGYNIFVIFSGDVNGRVIVGSNFDAGITTMLKDMATFYRKEKCWAKQGYFNKFKI